MVGFGSNYLTTELKFLHLEDEEVMISTIIKDTVDKMSSKDEIHNRQAMIVSSLHSFLLSP